jgi:hypothetical protein
MVKCTFDRKSMPMVAWYVLSNESYMKRVIKDVLPTAQSHQYFRLELVSLVKVNRIPLCSPKNTSLQRISIQRPTFTAAGNAHLNFFSGFEYPDCAIVKECFPQTA